MKIRNYADEMTFWEKIQYWDFWRSDFWDSTKFIGGILLLFALIIGLIILFFSFGDYKACNAYSLKGIETQWSFWTGCLANHPKFGWIPIEEYFKTFNIYNP
jgi:hypothetical protein